MHALLVALHEGAAALRPGDVCGRMPALVIEAPQHGQLRAEIDGFVLRQGITISAR